MVVFPASAKTKLFEFCILSRWGESFF